MVFKIMMIVSTVLFFSGSLILVNRWGLYVSPDETANAFFATQFATEGVLSGPYDELLERFDRLHPRSMVAAEGRLLPGSFLGLPFLYGIVSAVIGKWVFWILTPLVTVVAAHGWRRLVAWYLSEPIGSFAYALFLLHPALWYYSARGLMHNVLFIDLLILSAWMWLLRPCRSRAKPPSVSNDILAGLFLGLAIFVRTSEVVWIAAAFVSSLIIWARALSLRRLRAGLLGLGFGIGLLLIMNTLTYGHPFTIGYTLDQPPITQFIQGETTDAIGLLPFGFHPMNAWRHFSSYAAFMFWWLSILALPGFFFLLAHRPHRKTIRCAVALGSIVSFWLVLMYGSWEIHDNPDPTQITMANSYVRYWLPMYVFMTPMIAITIQWISTRSRSALARGLTAAILLLAVIGLNVNAVFLQGQDGLFAMRSELARAGEIQASVLERTQSDAVVIVDRADKFFFPHRRVLYPLRDEATYELMSELVEATTLYYYGITLPEDDFDYLNHSRLQRMNLRIEQIATYGEESLYHIFKP